MSLHNPIARLLFKVIGKKAVAFSPKLIAELFRSEFRKLKKEDLIPADIDLNKVFKQISESVFRKAPLNIDADDKEFMVLEALAQVVTRDTISKFDSEKDFVKYFGGMFQLRLITLAKQHVTRLIREQNESQYGGDDDARSILESHSPLDSKTPEKEVSYDKMLKEINTLLNRESSKKILVPLFNLLLEGHSNTEVAEILNISKGAVSQNLDKLRDFLKEYAIHSNNTLLAHLLVEFGKYKKHSRIGSEAVAAEVVASEEHKALLGPDFSMIKDLFSKYKRASYNLATVSEDFSHDDEPLSAEIQIDPTPEEVHDLIVERLPVGDTTQIEILGLDDLFGEQATIDMFMDPNLSSEQREAQIQNFIQALDRADEIIDDDKLYLLNIQEANSYKAKRNAAKDFVEEVKQMLSRLKGIKDLTLLKLPKGVMEFYVENKGTTPSFVFKDMAIYFQLWNTTSPKTKLVSESMVRSPQELEQLLHKHVFNKVRASATSTAAAPEGEVPVDLTFDAPAPEFTAAGLPPEAVDELNSLFHMSSASEESVAEESLIDLLDAPNSFVEDPEPSDLLEFLDATDPAEGASIVADDSNPGVDLEDDPINFIEGMGKASQAGALKDLALEIDYLWEQEIPKYLSVRKLKDQPVFFKKPNELWMPTSDLNKVVVFKRELSGRPHILAGIYNVIYSIRESRTQTVTPKKVLSDPKLVGKPISTLEINGEDDLPNKDILYSRQRFQEKH